MLFIKDDFILLCLLVNYAGKSSKDETLNLLR